MPNANAFAVSASRLRGRLRDNLSILSATAFLSGIHSNMVAVVWQPFALSLGASIPTLGLLSSLGGFGGIATALNQPIGGWLADRIGRKPPVVWASVVLIAAYILYTLAGLLSTWTILIPGITLLGISAINRPARSSLTAESVAAEQRGMGYSIVQVATALPGVFAPVLGGFIADRATATAIFPLCIAFEAMSLFLVVRYLTETHVPNRRIVWAELWPVLKRAVVPPPGLVGFAVCLAGDSFVWGLGLGVLFVT
jgi:MFS family permease